MSATCHKGSKQSRLCKYKKDVATPRRWSCMNCPKEFSDQIRTLRNHLVNDCSGLSASEKKETNEIVEEEQKAFEQSKQKKPKFSKHNCKGMFGYYVITNDT